MEPVTKKDFLKLATDQKKDFLKLTADLTHLIKSEFSNSGKKLYKQVQKQLKFQTEILSDKVEYQLEETIKELKSQNLNFKDEIITELKDLRLETAVNSSRITKVEKHVFAN